MFIMLLDCWWYMYKAHYDLVGWIIIIVVVVDQNVVALNILYICSSLFFLFYISFFLSTSHKISFHRDIFYNSEFKGEKTIKTLHPPMNAFVYLSQTSESKYFVVLLEKSKANDKNKNFLAIEFRLLFDI